MSGSGVVRRVVLGSVALLLPLGVLTAAPAEAGADGFSSWVTREDASGTSAGPGQTSSWTGDEPAIAARALTMPGSAVPNLISAGTEATLAHVMSLEFTAPEGQGLLAGATYPVFAGPGEATAKVGRLLVWHDEVMCGMGWDEVFPRYRTDAVATGTFHITELEQDDSGTLTRFAATYVLSCQTLGGQRGLEGSVAVNATAPAASVPDEPVSPGPVTGLRATNVGPDGSGVNVTTLSWDNPAAYGDVIVDMVQSPDRTKLRALVGTDFHQQFRGRASQYVDRNVEFMDTRTYRVVPRGPTGRLGAPSFVTVQGTRLDVTNWLTQTITLGAKVKFSGRLTLRLGVDPDGDKPPALPGRVVVLCGRSTLHYSDQGCTEIDRTRTSDDGRFSLTATPRENMIYDFEVPATDRMVGNTLRAANAWVAPVTDLAAPESERVSARSARVGARTAVRRGSVIHFSTVRAPAGSRGLVRLQRYDGHTWRTVLTKRFATRGSGARRLAIPYRERKSGAHLYRVVKLGDKRHVDGISRKVRVRVR